MPDYTGIVVVDQRQRKIHVAATTSLLRIVVDGVVAFDKKFFVNTSEREASFDLAGRAATVRWDGLGATVSVAGTSVELDRAAKGGAVRPALTAAEKETILARQAGGGLLALGVVLLFLEWSELSSSHRYHSYLALVPWVILLGLVALFRPRLIVEAKDAPNRGVLLAAGVVFLVVAYFFVRWFIRIALGPGWTPAGWL